MRKRTNRKARSVRRRRDPSDGVGVVWKATDEYGQFRAYLVTDANRRPTPLAWVPMHRGGLALARKIAHAVGRRGRTPAIDLRSHSPAEMVNVIAAAELRPVSNRGNLMPGRFAWASYFVPRFGLWAGELVFYWRVEERQEKSGRLFSEATAPKPGRVRGRTRRKTVAA